MSERECEKNSVSECLVCERVRKCVQERESKGRDVCMQERERERDKEGVNF